MSTKKKAPGKEPVEKATELEICNVCHEPIDPEDEAPCKECEHNVHEGCLADWNICKGCAGEVDEEE